MQVDLVQRFAGNVSRRLAAMVEGEGITQQEILGRSAVDRQTLWVMKNLKRDPKLSTMLRLASAVEAVTKEQFAELLTT